MKQLALLLTLVSMVAQAEVIYEGRFGTEGSTGESSPKTDSVKSAAAIYKALKVKADGRGTKKIELADESFFSCEKPYSGLSRVQASCEFILRASQKPKVQKGPGFTGNVTFTGELAAKVLSAIPETGARRVGATVREVGNLKCTKVARPSIPATCTISNTQVMKIDADI